MAKKKISKRKLERKLTCQEIAEWIVERGSVSAALCHFKAVQMLAQDYLDRIDQEHACD